MIIQEPSDDFNLEDFDMAWQVTRDNYPYFELKGVDWDEIYAEYYPKAVSASGDEIYTVLLDMFAHLKDGHMYIETPGGKQLIPWVPTRRLKDIYAFKASLIGTYFEEELLIDEEGNINYQVLPGNIGYLNIRSFAGEYNFKSLYGIFNLFRNTDGLIVDLRHNYGGDIHNVDKLVCNFIEDIIPRNPYYNDFERIEMDSIRPCGNYTYLNPVVLLINGVSYSGSEIAAEIFKEQVPQATLVGDTTGGGSLGYLNKYKNGNFRLPSGKLIHIGNLDVRKYNDQPFENIGILPDILLPQTEADIQSGHDRQLEFAIEYLASRKSASY